MSERFNGPDFGARIPFTGPHGPTGPTALALPAYKDALVEMLCFNNAERDEIARRLTPEERLRVVWNVPFHWPPTECLP